MTEGGSFRVIYEPGGARPSDYRLVDDAGQEPPAASAFLDATAIRGLSQQTLRTYAYALQAAWEWLTDRGLELGSLSEAELPDFVLHLKQRAGPHHPPAPRSLNLRLSVLRALYAFLEGREMSTPKGTPKEPKPVFARRRFSRKGLPQRTQARRARFRVKEPKRLIKPLTREQVDRFFGVLRSFRDVAITSLMLFCGLRSRELLGLCLQDLDFTNEQIRIHGKGQKERLLPLPRDARSALRRYLESERPSSTSDLVFLVAKGPRRGLPLSPAGLRAVFRHHRVKSGVPEAHPHRFRHTFASDMVRAGMSLAVLQRLMGHSSIEMTMRYVELSTSDIREELRQALERRSQDPGHAQGG